MPFTVHFDAKVCENMQVISIGSNVLLIAVTTHPGNL